MRPNANIHYAKFSMACAGSYEPEHNGVGCPMTYHLGTSSINNLGVGQKPASSRRSFTICARFYGLRTGAKKARRLQSLTVGPCNRPPKAVAAPDMTAQNAGKAIRSIWQLIHSDIYLHCS